MQTLEPSSEPSSEPAPAGARRARRQWGRMLAVLVGALVLAAALGWLALRWITPHPYSGTVMQAPTAAPSMDGLIFTDGTPVDVTAFDGDLLLVYFGYTNCPDVCPTTLYDLKKALEQLGGKADRIDVAMGTIDPERDTDDVITGYLHSFIAGGHALRTADQEVLTQATQAFGASYSVTTGDDGVIEVSHSPFMYLVDEHADIVLTWPFGLPSDAIAIDLDIMLDTIDGKA